MKTQRFRTWVWGSVGTIIYGLTSSADTAFRDTLAAIYFGGGYLFVNWLGNEGGAMIAEWLHRATAPKH